MILIARNKFMNKLILFDIDGTLVDTGGAGMDALTSTATEVFGAEGPELDLAGSTDSGIVMGMMEHFGVEVDLDEFYQIYLNKLPDSLDEYTDQGKVLPGVVDLLQKLSQTDMTLGILTGNVAEGAQIKLDHYGLAQHFEIGAYGDDHYDRNELGNYALKRARDHYGIDFQGVDAVVIGDTPKDINCGRAMGAKTIAVATGSFSYDELEAHKPDLVIESCLADDLVRYICEV